MRPQNYVCQAPSAPFLSNREHNWDFTVELSVKFAVLHHPVLLALCLTMVCACRAQSAPLMSSNEHWASLKIISVSGGAAECRKKGQLWTFFFHFCKKKKFLQRWTIFSYRKKKWKKNTKIAAARLAIITATRWTGNRPFFVDSPAFICKIVCHHAVFSCSELPE